MQRESAFNPRLVYITTNAISARLCLRGQLAYMRRQGFDVSLITADDPTLNSFARQEGVRLYQVPMNREMSPTSDLVAVGRITRLLRKLRPAIVNASTPKAGLLGMVAARLVGVPVRIYTLRGLRLETTAGWKYRVLRWAEKTASSAAHQVVCNSESLRRLYVELNLAKDEKTAILASGSGNGVNVERFRFDSRLSYQAAQLRSHLKIDPKAQVVGFVGRLTKDKGIVDLVDAFDAISKERPQLHLLLVGAFEAGDPVPERVMQHIQQHPRISVTGFVPDTTPYYSLFDLVAFPSYREGFPNVPMEAAAAGLPVVAYQATGTIDAVVNGETGLLVPIEQPAELAEAIRRYLDDDHIRKKHGQAGKVRVQAKFRPETVWEALYDIYVRLLAESNMALPRPVVISPRLRQAA